MGFLLIWCDLRLSIVMGVPSNGQFIWENPSKIRMIWGYLYFRKPPCISCFFKGNSCGFSIVNSRIRLFSIMVCLWLVIIVGSWFVLAIIFLPGRSISLINDLEYMRGIIFFTWNSYHNGGMDNSWFMLTTIVRRNTNQTRRWPTVTGG